MMTQPSFKTFTDPSSASQSEAIDWITLARLPNVSPSSFWSLIQHYGSASSALNSLPSRWRQKCTDAGQSLESVRKKVIVDVEKHHQKGGGIVLANQPNYPPLLKEIQDPPPVLWVFGDLTLFASSLTPLAMVGGRNASLSGQKFAYTVAQSLSETGITICSGMAHGIDTAAHKGCLAGPSPTIAVLAGGVDVIYPKDNKDLYDRIRQHGLIISEMPLGTPPVATLFPRRNRIISGLSQGTLVIEASLRSGSLITARYALEQNRDVFAVPGFPLDTRHHGSNALLKQGATLVESADDVLAILAATPLLSATQRPHRVPNPASLEPSFFEEHPDKDRHSLQDTLLRLLSAEQIHVDQLIQHTNAPAAVIHAALLDLELSGKIQRHTGNTVSLSYG